MSKYFIMLKKKARHEALQLNASDLFRLAGAAG
jgi:hypothetical protein